MVSSNYVLLLALAFPAIAPSAIILAYVIIPTLPLSRFARTALGLAAFGAVIACLIIGPSGNFTVALPLGTSGAAGTSLLIAISPVPRATRAISAAGLTIAALVFVVVVAPPLMSKHQARYHRNHPHTLPRVELLLTRPVDPETERAEDGTMRSGPWRVIRINSGRL